MNEETTTQEPKKTGTLNQGAMYSIIAAKFPKIIEALEKGLEDPNSAVRVGAAKVLLNKILPDLKSVEVGGGMQSDGTRRAIELFVNVGGGFVPTTLSVSSSSATSTPAVATEIQGLHMAPQSTQDIHSDNGDNQTGTP